MGTDASTETAARRLLTMASELGVEYIFTNLGSDHPAFIEAFAHLHEHGGRMPQIVVCPHEMTALTAAHGYAMKTRRAQMVLVHVDVGTQNLGCSIHNAARGRVPAIVVAGLSPVTIDGDRAGARTEFIHYTQDTTRQHEIGGQYMKWSYELRAGEMADAVLLRGMQLACTAPEGPVYITGAREVWDEPAGTAARRPALWPAVQTSGLPAHAVPALREALAGSRRPLIITTYLGRQTAAVERLVALSERYGIAVCEVNPQYVNFPGNHPHHVGYRRNALVDEADLILMLDVDVPWIMSKVQPAADARLFHIDMDAIKPALGFWHFPAEASFQADTLLALDQLLAGDAHEVGDRAARCAWIADVRGRPSPTPPEAPGDALSVTQVTEAVRELINERTVVVFESPSGTERVLSTLRMSRPGSYYANGGSGLGWGVNAAIGIRLADPEAEVICLTGDGSYLFSVPSSAYWVSANYQAPQLTVIYNNRGWNSPKVSTLLVHPQGTARRNDTYWITMTEGSRLAEVAAAAGGAAAFRVTEASQLRDTLQQAMAIVRGGRSAVVEAMVAPISGQSLA